MTPKKKLLLVTAGFPFGEWERGFLSTEFGRLCEMFSVTVLSVGREDALLYPVDETVRVERFLYPKAAGSDRLKTFRHMLSPVVFSEVLRAVKTSSFKRALSRVSLICAYYDRAKQLFTVMEKLMKEQQVDIVYTYWATEAAVAACLLKYKYPSLRFITRFHGHDLYAERKASDWQPFRTWIRTCADRLVFACRFGMDYFLQHWGGEEKAVLHYLGCTEVPAHTHLENKTLRIVSCSNLIPLKRVDCIIDALSLLPKDMNVRWDHFGDGTEAASLKQRAEEALSENIAWTFHGHIPNHQLRDRYRELDPDVFLTVSSTEGGVPVSIQEAFSMGIPAIGSAVGGIPEAVISEKTGFLLSANASPAETAEAIKRYAELPAENKAAFSKAAFAMWETNFNAHQDAENFMNELLQVAE